MNRYNKFDCGCQDRDFDRDFRDSSYWDHRDLGHGCGHDCGCHSSCGCSGSRNCSGCWNRCRRDLCSTAFRIRLAGLTHGMNYRMYQLLCFNVSLELENGQSVYGKVVNVGSNFVELLLPAKNEDIESSSEEDDAAYGKDRNRHHKPGKTIIISMERVVSIKTDH